MVLAPSTHQPHTQLALSPPLASVFIRRPFFLSHRDRNLASRHGKCQGSCLGPSFRLRVCQKRGKAKHCGSSVKESVRPPVRICSRLGMETGRPRNFKGKGMRGNRGTLQRPLRWRPLRWQHPLNFTSLSFGTGSSSSSLVTALGVDSDGGGEATYHLLRVPHPVLSPSSWPSCLLSSASRALPLGSLKVASNSIS